MTGPTPQQLIADLARAFPRQPVTPDQLRIYLQKLAGVPAALLEVSVDELIRTSVWFPTVSEILEVAAERHLALPDEVAALAQVEERMAWARDDRRVDGSAAPEVHPTVRRALDHVGGFHALRATERPDVARGQFLKVYRDLRARAIREAKLGELRSALDAAPPKELGA